MGSNQKRRRRITRRSGTPRSSTTPDLSRGPSAMADSAGGATTGPPTDAGSLPDVPSALAVPAVADDDACRSSPVPSSRSGSGSTTHGKKKHGKFSFKLKDNQPKSSHGAPYQTSPLPLLTPSKAARVLGIGCSPATTQKQPPGGRDVYDDELDEFDDLDDLPDSASIQSRPGEEDAATDTEKFKCLSEFGNKTAQGISGFRPVHASRISHGAGAERAMTNSPTSYPEKEVEDGSGSETDFHACPGSRSSASRPVAEPVRRRMRKKVPKSLDRMTPITEASHDELRASYQESEQNTELELISEYERDCSYFGRPLSRSRNTSLLTTNARYELDKGDLSPTDEELKERAVTGGKEYVVRPANQVDSKNPGRQLPAVVSPRGPLQVFEDRLLDEAEEKLADLRIKLDVNDASRSRLDAEVSSLRASHQAMKVEFAAIRPDLLPREHDSDGKPEDEDEDDDDLVSICSSIDLDEEPVVEVAKAMTVMRVTPGMVKLVDIPPRRKPSTMTPGNKPVPAPPGGGVRGGSAKHLQQGLTGPPKRQSPNVKPTTMTHHLTQNHNRSHQANKGKMPRDQSRIMAQHQTSPHDHAKQRPLPKRLDTDAPADQEIRPAAFSKEENTATPTLPPRTSSKEHYCLKNGHIFHPVNLKTIPDEAALNALQVRPYLRTNAGRKTHVHVPVFCDRCGDDVKEQLWECDVAVCRMVVCKQCAADMEREWKKRVCAAWQY